ncbi:uncharacterized protein LOC112183370 isoform X2 [Rosa chinensis]|uniref:uncharacterized protein LOC112183370 isoform X2 n=1 Tax=Rosa chinensis TaxID=74649 RepID=UPI000D08B8C7|nr:uncharacterized protein LOC112183370 isoform X2 [Rosa chinensis]
MAPSILIPNSIYDSYRKRSRAKSNRRRKLLSSRLTILQIHLSHDDTGIDARSGALLQNKDAEYEVADSLILYHPHVYKRNDFQWNFYSFSTIMDTRLTFRV